MRTVALLVAVFGAGIALGYVFGDIEAGPGRSASGPRPVVGPEPSVAAPRVAPPPSLRAVLDRIPAPEVPRGEGTIRGYVRMEGGEPVADALVVARPTSGGPRRKYRRGLAGPDEQEVDKWVYDLVARRKGRDAARREARTDTAGAYEITGVTDAKHSVSAFAAGFQCTAARGSSAYNVRPNATVDFVARPVVEVAVDVLRPDGSRPPRATIECRGAATRKESWFPGERWIQLWPGTYTVRAVVDQSRSEEQTILVEAGRPGPSLVFRLEESPGLRGRILFPPELQAAQVSVYTLLFAGTEPPDHARLTAEGKNTSTAGAYAFENLEPGSYLVGAGYGDKSVAATAVVRIGDGVVEQDLQLPPPDAERFVIVHVLGPEGERPSSVRFETSYSGGSLGASGGGRSFLRSDGAYFVPHHSWDTLRYGSNHADPRWFVKAVSDDFGAIKKEYSPGKDKELTIRFQPGARLTARIAGYVDSGHEGHLLVALKEAGAYDPYLGRRHRELMPDEEGRQLLGPFQPGSYEAILVLRRPLGVSWPLERVPLVLRPGENELAIPLPALHTLTVVSKAGRRVSVVSDEDRYGRRTLQRSIDADGKATFEHLPAGAYRVTVRNQTGAKHQSATVEVPAQATVHLP
jgi:hypothetical protein